ncbi:MAG: nucleotidyltransferase family protein [Desulfobacterales bacterium]|nr:nucleotidyltransferase family protein [Desulfobacterales bacterium]
MAEGLDTIDAIAMEIAPILKNGGVTEASVFGSVARGEATGKSDLDLLVRYRKGLSLFDVGDLLTKLEQKTGRRVDLVSIDYLKPRLKKHVMKDLVRIL